MAMKPCTNNQQLESLQKQALLDALKDAVKAESKRLDRLEKANPKEKAALENRFAEERLTDKTKISRLKEDFESLAVKLRSGELDISQSSRVIRTDQVGVTKIKTIDKNRFQGLESDSDVRFHTKMCQKLEREQQRGSLRPPVVDTVGDLKKLELLTKKRDVLCKLITLQRRELQAYDGDSSTARSSLRSSMSSARSDLSSRESWASFASTSRPLVQRVSSKASLIPKLPIL